jgi:hypothetical protein
MIICAAVARAGDVKVKAVLSTGIDDEPTTSFAPDTPTFHALFKTKGAVDGTKLRALWIAEDVGDEAPANSKIDEKTLTLPHDTDDGDFSLSKPDKGWPSGKYRLEIYANGDLATTLKFTVKGESKKEKEKDKEEASSSDDEYSFKVHNATSDKIKKLLASEDGETYGNFDIGRAGIAPGETTTLKWDKSTNKSNCEWYIKAVFDDGSETKAKKFDFCEEDLVLDF